MRKKFYADGIKFECQMSGRCCRSRHADGYVYLSLKDRRRIASHLGISTIKFTRRYTTKTRNQFHFKVLRPQCAFLKDNQCSIYEARPLQCRTWPFWPENMKRKVWMRSITRSCPGVGKGRLYSASEIDEIVKLQKKEGG